MLIPQKEEEKEKDTDGRFHGMVSRLDPSPGQEFGGEQENAFRAVSRYLKDRDLKWFDLFRASALIESAGGIDNVSRLNTENQKLRQMVDNATRENERLAKEHEFSRSVPRLGFGGVLRRIPGLLWGLPAFMAFMARNFSYFLGANFAGIFIGSMFNANAGMIFCVSSALWLGGTLLHPIEASGRQIVAVLNIINRSRRNYLPRRLHSRVDAVVKIIQALVMTVPSAIIIAVYPSDKSTVFDHAFDKHINQGMTADGAQILHIRDQGSLTNKLLIAEFKVLKTEVSSALLTSGTEEMRNVCATIEVRPLAEDVRNAFARSKIIFYDKTHTETICRPVSTKEIPHQAGGNYGPQ